MDEFLEALVASLAPFGATFDGERLMVSGCRYTVWYSTRERGWSLDGRTFRPQGRGRNRGYDVAAAVAYVLQRLPYKMEQRDRRLSLKERKQVMAQFGDVAESQWVRLPQMSEGGYTEVSYDSVGFNVKFTVKDFATFCMVVDMVSERI